MRIVEGTASIEDVTAFVDRLGEIGERHGCALAAFDPRYVAGRDHLAAAVEGANRAFEREDAIADDRSIEILLYAAGRRQIDRALELGVDPGVGAVVVVIDGANGDDGEERAAADVRSLLDPEPVMAAERDPELIREYFDVTEAELGATDASLEALVVERVALLVVRK